MQKRKIVCCGGLLAATGVLLFLACQNPSGGEREEFTRGEIGPRYDANGYEVKTLAYVELNRESPLNVGSYVMEKMEKDDNGNLVPVLNANGNPEMQPLFDYVVLFAANIRQRNCALETDQVHGCTENGVHLHLNENVRYVLEHRSTYLQPLQKKGIKVLLGLLGDHDGLTFGTMSKDQIDTFFKSVKDAVAYYDLDGVDFDDEWGTQEDWGDTSTNPPGNWVGGNPSPNTIAVYPEANFGWPMSVTIYRDPSKPVGLLNASKSPFGSGNGWTSWNDAKNAMNEKSGRTMYEVLKAAKAALPGKAITLYEIGAGDKVTPNGVANNGTWGAGAVFPDNDATTAVTVTDLSNVIDIALQPYYNRAVWDSYNGLPNSQFSPLALDVGGFAYSSQNGTPNPPWSQIEGLADQYRAASDAGNPYGVLFVYDMRRNDAKLSETPGGPRTKERREYLNLVTQKVFEREVTLSDHADYPHWTNDEY